MVSQCSLLTWWPWWQDLAASKVRLSGYGVELAIKSTEYKAQDDTKVREEGAGDAAAQDQPDDVEGFLFNRLRSVGRVLFN